MEARALIERLSRDAALLRDQLILAPLLTGGRIRTRLDGLVYEFRVRDAFSGWGHFRALDEQNAVPAGDAQPWERAAYLEMLPLLRVILLRPDAHHAGTWWALPFNQSDAHQRFGLTGDPLPVFLCDPTDGADRFERVLTRVDGNAIWYEGPDPLADPTHAQWLREAAEAGDVPARYPAGMPGSARLALLQQMVHVATQAARAHHAGAHPTEEDQDYDPVWPTDDALSPSQDSVLEGRLRRALAKADATLLRFSEVPGHRGEPGALVVEWSEQGQRYRYRSLLARDLTVVSSGICLSGRDRDFDLTSLVSVLADR